MKNTTHFLVLFLALSIFIRLSGQPLFLYEDFENGPPEGWAMDGLWEHGNSELLSNREGWDNFFVPAHGHFMGLNGESSPPGPFTEALLISPPINLERATQPLLLTFDAFFPNLDLGADEKASVLISPDGEDWSRAYVLDGFSNCPDEWAKHGVFLGEAYNGREVYIAFQYSDGGARNTGLCIDNVRLQYATQRRPFVTVRPLHRYSRVTSRQYQPFRWEISLQQAGAGRLENISMRRSLIVNGTTDFNTVNMLPSLLPGEIFRDTLSFATPEFGHYRNFIILRDEEADTTLLIESSEFYHSESILAQDDGQKDIALSFGFNNPRWYGYYGAGYHLRQPDTLIGISTYIVTDTDSIYADRGPGSGNTFNLSVYRFDEAGQIGEEAYHSESIPTGEEPEAWVYHELPQPLPLSPAKYLLSAGQDGPQGLIGFGFDEQPGGQSLWRYSPVARGGIPWENDISHRYRLMIRLHFKPLAALTAVDEALLTRQQSFRLWPNPCTHQLNMEFTIAHPGPALISVTGMDGRIWKEEQTPVAGRQTLSLQGLPAGLYFLRAKFEDGKVFTQKFLKRE